MKVIDDKILCVQEDRTLKAGALTVPKSVVANAAAHKVVKIGHGRWEDGKIIPQIVKIGDRVIIDARNAYPIKINGTEHVLCERIDVLVILGADDNLDLFQPDT